MILYRGPSHIFMRLTVKTLLIYCSCLDYEDKYLKLSKSDWRKTREIEGEGEGERERERERERGEREREREREGERERERGGEDKLKEE